MGKIMLEELLQYMNSEDDPADRIQVASDFDDWEKADELNVTSALLRPFKNWIVTEMRIEEAFIDKKPVLRVFIVPE